MTREERIKRIAVRVRNGTYDLDRAEAIDAVVDGLTEAVFREEMARQGEPLPLVRIGQGDYAQDYTPGVGSPFFRGFAIAICCEAAMAAVILWGLHAIGWY